jgi:hypothetical protein
VHFCRERLGENLAYVSSNVASILDRINHSYFLPAIQRPYVWQPDQIVALFDSLLKGYPISSFLLWEIKPDRRADWEIYKFIENFRFGDTHNELAEPNGRDVILVLDGQQRLTSLLIGLCGSFTVRAKYARRSNTDAWNRQRLFIDLLRDSTVESGDDNDREDLGITYGLRFFGEDPTAQPGRLWMKLGRILDCTSDNAFDDLKDTLLESLPDTTTKGQQRTVEKNLDRLYRTIWKDEVISYYTEKDQSYDRVLDIFIRANDGGTKLSKSDLLLSMITSKWEGVSARQEIFDFVDFINTGLDGKNELDKDFVMKSSLVLSDLDQRYKVSNFTNANLKLIESNWKSIKLSIESTIRLVNRFGIDRENLTSANALLPIAYYLYRTGSSSLDGSTPFEVSNAIRIHRWLIGSLLNGVFGGSSDSTIGTSRSIIQSSLANSRDFPYRALVEGLARRGRLVNFDDNNLEGVIETNYGQRNCFLALSLLYDTNNWGSVKHHMDHIIPRSLADRKALMARNMPEPVIKGIVESVNRLGNLQLLLGRENLEKSNIPFAQWIKSRDPEFLKRHFIPDDPDLWEVEALPQFVAAREKLIRHRLTQIAMDPVTPLVLSTQLEGAAEGN